MPSVKPINEFNDDGFEESFNSLDPFKTGLMSVENVEQEPIHF